MYRIPFRFFTLFVFVIASDVKYEECIGEATEGTTMKIVDTHAARSSIYSQEESHSVTINLVAKEKLWAHWQWCHFWDLKERTQNGNSNSTYHTQNICRLFLLHTGNDNLLTSRNYYETVFRYKCLSLHMSLSSTVLIWFSILFLLREIDSFFSFSTCIRVCVHLCVSQHLQYRFFVVFSVLIMC